MKQKETELLLKDLCGRSPYGVKVNNEILGNFEVYGICENFVFARTEACHVDFDIKKVKPYLFPLSSMTEEQKKEFIKYAGYEKRDEDCGRHQETYYYDMVGHEDSIYPNSDAIDWLNKNHFDYRGLIEKGLAIDATRKNIY